ncbi:hypothetical protein BDR07DRAFT_1442036 [Suillus spraguei]|nr:hypothetical protein BDR07DRAFT_1442036 [Suillus spraguei]
MDNSHLLDSNTSVTLCFKFPLIGVFSQTSLFLSYRWYHVSCVVDLHTALYP